MKRSGQSRKKGALVSAVMQDLFRAVAASYCAITGAISPSMLTQRNLTTWHVLAHLSAASASGSATIAARTA